MGVLEISLVIDIESHCTLSSVANATADLLILAAWSSALDSFHGEPIPVCYMLGLRDMLVSLA